MYKFNPESLQSIQIPSSTIQEIVVNIVKESVVKKPSVSWTQFETFLSKQVVDVWKLKEVEDIAEYEEKKQEAYLDWCENEKITPEENQATATQKIIAKIKRTMLEDVEIEFTEEHLFGLEIIKTEFDLKKNTIFIRID